MTNHPNRSDKFAIRNILAGASKPLQIVDLASVTNWPAERIMRAINSDQEIEAVGRHSYRYTRPLAKASPAELRGRIKSIEQKYPSDHGHAKYWGTK